MDDPKLSDKHKNIIQKFTNNLKGIYGDNLVSVILYGSAASGEFIKKDSDLNLLVVLNKTEPEDLKKASRPIRRAGRINALLLSKDYIMRSLDIFPIEFLDMQENRAVILGQDVLKDITIDTRNLRFQCEQELKEKLIRLQKAYLKSAGNSGALRAVMFEAFNPVLHVARNLLRLKGKQPPYLKDEILKDLSALFFIDTWAWKKVSDAKNKRARICCCEVEKVFVGFLKGLEAMTEAADKL